MTVAPHARPTGSAAYREPAALLAACREAVPRRLVFPLGLPEVDARLGGGLEHGVLHEILAPTGADGAAATGFALGLATRAGARRPVLWVRESLLDRRTGQPHGGGLAELGLDPGAVLLVRARDALGALRAAHEGARCAALGAVLLDLWGNPPALDLVAGKRLSLAASRSGVTVILLRVGAEPQPSAARTRWVLAAAPSPPLAPGTPGVPAFRARLVRHRGGVGDSEWHLEWNRERACFDAGLWDDGAVGPAEAALPRAVAAVPADRARPAGGAAR